MPVLRAVVPVVPVVPAAVLRARGKRCARPQRRRVGQPHGPPAFNPAPTRPNDPMTCGGHDAHTTHTTPQRSCSPPPTHHRHPWQRPTGRLFAPAVPRGLIRPESIPPIYREVKGYPPYFLLMCEIERGLVSPLGTLPTAFQLPKNRSYSTTQEKEKFRPPRQLSKKANSQKK